MKNKNLKRYSIILLVMVFVGSSALQAQQFQRGERPQPPQQEMQMAKKRGHKGPRIPNLSEEQKEQLKAFKVELEKNALPLKNQLGEKEARLKTLTTSESYDETAVNSVIEEIGDIKTEMMKLKVAQGEKIKSILTEEQLVAFNNQIAKGPKKNMRRGLGRHGR